MFGARSCRDPLGRHKDKPALQSLSAPCSAGALAFDSACFLAVLCVPVTLLFLSTGGPGLFSFTPIPFPFPPPNTGAATQLPHTLLVVLSRCSEGMSEAEQRNKAIGWKCWVIFNGFSSPQCPAWNCWLTPVLFVSIFCVSPPTPSQLLTLLFPVAEPVVKRHVTL